MADKIWGCMGFMSETGVPTCRAGGARRELPCGAPSGDRLDEGALAYRRGHGPARRPRNFQVAFGLWHTWCLRLGPRLRKRLSRVTLLLSPITLARFVSGQSSRIFGPAVLEAASARERPQMKIDTPSR